MAEALMQSCNVYFMQVGRWLGTARLREAMEQAGLSRRTGWPYGEEEGHLPHRRLTEGEVAMLAIGQGEILVTTMQEAVVASLFANGGRLVTPWVVRAVGDRAIALPAVQQPVGWSKETIRIIREGMIAVVRDPRGTGHRAFNPTVPIAGKTGTAQTHVVGQTHGWFVGFCPVERPRVAMAIVTEHGGSGGDLPAVIARTLCEYVATVGVDPPAQDAGP
jgi:cell division protein FtsI/penicillin-binding protein 2